MVTFNRRSNEFYATDNPTFGNVGVGGEAVDDHVAGMIEVNFPGVIGYIPVGTILNKSPEEVVVGHVSQYTIVVTPTVNTVFEGGDIVEHGVVVEAEIIVGDVYIHVVVTSGFGGEGGTSAVRLSVVGIAHPTSVIEGVSPEPTSLVDDEFFPSGNGDSTIVVGSNGGGNILTSIHVVEGSIDVVKGVGTIVVDQRIPSGVDSETLGNQAIATLGVFLSVGTHAEGISGDDAEVVNNPPVAIGGTSFARGESTESDAEVAGFKGIGWERVGYKALKYIVNRDIDCINVDIDSSVVNAIGAIVEFALVVVFDVVLVELDIKNGSAGGDIDVVNLDVGIEFAGAQSGLIVVVNHHEAVFARGDSGVKIINDGAFESGDASKTAHQVRIHLGHSHDGGVGVDISPTLPTSVVVVLGVGVNASSVNASGVAKVVAREVYGYQRGSILGEDGTLIHVRDIRGLGFGHVDSLVRCGGLCNHKRCA